MESLAKGAVQFSRRFTIRELRDRWHSLLYDLNTSTEASAQIVKIEIELAASNLPKASRTCNPNSKVKESSSGKRKVDSVRSHYYAMRKRIRSEPCATNLSFLEPSALLAATGCDSGTGDQLKPQIKPPADNFGLEIPFSGDYRHPEAGYDGGQHAFSEQMRVCSAAGNGNVHHQLYHAGHMGSVEDEIPDGASPEGGLFAYPGNLSSAPCDDSECNNGNQSFEHNFQQRDFPHILGENLIDTSSDVHEISQPNALAKSSPYKNEDIGDKPLSGFDSPNNNREGVRSDFVRNNSLSSHVQDYGYSSPPSGMPMWRTIEDISTPTMRMDGHYGDKEQGLLNMEDHKNISAPGCDVVSSEPKLDDGMCGAGLHNPTVMPENDSMNFSDTYMDFPDDEILLFIDVNEKDNADSSCLGLSSILLSSPSDTHHGVANAKDLGAENVLESCLGIPDAACSGEPNVACDQTNSGLHNDHNTSVSGVNMPSTSSQTSNTAELQEKFMLCVVNRQDLEIPNNDHVIFPPPFSSNLEQSTRGITGPVSSDTVLSTDWRDPVGDLNKVKEHVANMQLTVSPSKESSPRLPKVGVLHSCDGRAVEAEPSKGGSIAGGCKDADSAVDEQKPCKSETVGLNSTPIAAMKEEATALCFQNQDNPDTSFASFLENHLQEIDDAKIHPLNATDTYPEEASMQVGLKTCLPSPTNVVSAEVGFSDTVAITSTSDQEEQFSDSEDDVPYFSDIESLVKSLAWSFMCFLCMCPIITLFYLFAL